MIYLTYFLGFLLWLFLFSALTYINQKIARTKEIEGILNLTGLIFSICLVLDIIRWVGG